MKRSISDSSLCFARRRPCKAARQVTAHETGCLARDKLCGILRDTVPALAAPGLSDLVFDYYARDARVVVRQMCNDWRFGVPWTRPNDKPARRRRRLVEAVPDGQACLVHPYAVDAPDHGVTWEDPRADLPLLRLPADPPKLRLRLIEKQPIDVLEDTYETLAAVLELDPLEGVNRTVPGRLDYLLTRLVHCPTRMGYGPEALLRICAVVAARLGYFPREVEDAAFDPDASVRRKLAHLLPLRRFHHRQNHPWPWRSSCEHPASTLAADSRGRLRLSCVACRHASPIFSLELARVLDNRYVQPRGCKAAWILEHTSRNKVVVVLVERCHHLPLRHELAQSRRVTHCLPGKPVEDGARVVLLDPKHEFELRTALPVEAVVLDLPRTPADALRILRRVGVPPGAEVPVLCHAYRVDQDEERLQTFCTRVAEETFEFID